MKHRKGSKAYYHHELNGLLTTLKDEQQVHPRDKTITAALRAIKTAKKTKREDRLSYLIKIQDRGDVLYFRDIPEILHTEEWRRIS